MSDKTHLVNEDAALQCQRAIEGHVKVLRQFVGTDVHGHVNGLLEALKQSYMLDLVDVTPEQLQLKQGALRQVIALQAALTGGMATLPKV